MRPARLAGPALKVLAVGALLLTALSAAPYVLVPESYDDVFGARDPDRRRQAAALLHIGPATVALLVGGLLFGLAGRLPRRLHEMLGEIYVISVGLSAAGAALLVPHALGGAVGVAGFLVLTVFWANSTGLGALNTLCGNRIEHRAWMIRSYALTVAGVSLRLQSPILTGLLDLSFDAVYAITAWSSWVPNLIVAEALVRRPSRRTEPISAGTLRPVRHGPTTGTDPPA